MSFLDEVDSLRRKSGFSPSRKAVVVGLIIVLVVIAVLGAQLAWGVFTEPGLAEEESSLVIKQDENSTSESLEDSPDATEADETSEGQEASTSTIYVHVTGAVAKPGLYTLSTGARVQDAVAAAGGLSEDALEQSINLARVVTDGEQIIVASKNDSSTTSSSATSSQSGSTASSSISGKVNINQASAEELMTLQGIGQATAAKIIAYREEHGLFKKIEDIKQVSGIGDKKFETIRDSITV